MLSKQNDLKETQSCPSWMVWPGGPDFAMSDVHLFSSEHCECPVSPDGWKRLLGRGPGREGEQDLNFKTQCQKRYNFSITSAHRVRCGLRRSQSPQYQDELQRFPGKEEYVGTFVTDCVAQTTKGMKRVVVKVRTLEI